MKRKWIAALLAGCMLAALLLTGCSAAETVKRLRFGVAGEGGVYHNFGEQFAALENETSNGTIELRTTAGSAANLRLLTGEYLQLAIAQADLAQDACNQTGIFAEEEDIRGFGAVAALYTEACQVIVRADSDIQSIEDFIVSNNLLPLGSLFYVLFCVTKGGWGWDNFLAEADTGKGVKFPAWSKLWLKFGIPALIIIILVRGCVPKFATGLGLS